MDESSSSVITDISLASKETESSTSVSFEVPPIITSELKSHIINAVYINLKEIIEENKQTNRDRYPSFDIFYLEKVPPISLNSYIKRLVKYSGMDISSLILSIIYIDMFCIKYKYILTLNNIYRLLLSSCLLSIKFNEDITVDTKTYADIAGVTVRDLNNLELNLYVLLDYKLTVEDDYYQQYFAYFSKFVQAKEEEKNEKIKVKEKDKEANLEKKEKYNNNYKVAF